MSNGPPNLSKEFGEHPNKFRLMNADASPNTSEWKLADCRAMAFFLAQLTGSLPTTCLGPNLGYTTWPYVHATADIRSFWFEPPMTMDRNSQSLAIPASLFAVQADVGHFDGFLKRNLDLRWAQGKGLDDSAQFLPRRTNWRILKKGVCLLTRASKGWLCKASARLPHAWTKWTMLLFETFAPKTHQF